LIPGVLLVVCVLTVSVLAQAVDNGHATEIPREPSGITIPGEGKVIKRVMNLPGLENVGIVAPGILRGAQPDPEGYRTLKEMGVKTVINLRTTMHEKEAVEALGMRSIEIPISMVKLVEKEKVDAVLAAMHDPANQPVYVHCKLGQDRTGIVVASYRVVYDHWTLEEAEEEMQSYGFNDLWQHLKHFLHEYVEDMYRKNMPKDPDKDRQTFKYVCNIVCA